MGNGVYSWKGSIASDTRVLFLIGVLRSKKMNLKKNRNLTFF